MIKFFNDSNFHFLQNWELVLEIDKLNFVTALIIYKGIICKPLTLQQAGCKI
jgi:hypothetical protein